MKISYENQKNERYIAIKIEDKKRFGSYLLQLEDEQNFIILNNLFKSHHVFVFFLNFASFPNFQVCENKQEKTALRVFYENKFKYFTVLKCKLSLG